MAGLGPGLQSVYLSLASVRSILLRTACTLPARLQPTRPRSPHTPHKPPPPPHCCGQELYLLGNPCADWPGYRQFVVAKLPHLAKLVGAGPVCIQAHRLAMSC